jgi:hypothetical protein
MMPSIRIGRTNERQTKINPRRMKSVLGTPRPLKPSDLSMNDSSHTLELLSA